MKSIKTLALAAVTALAALAFVGVSPAMAGHTALCAEDETLCAEPITHVHEETLTGAKAKLLSSVLNVECDVLFLGDTLVALANPLVIHGAFTYSNCNNNCIVEEENGPAVLKILREESELAKVTGRFLIHMICSGFINCRYKPEGLVWHGLGPLTSSETNGSIVISEQPLEKDFPNPGSLCPTTTKLDITTTPLEPVYIST